MRRLWFLAPLMGAFCLLMFGAGSAGAAAPSNDNFANATTIAAADLPFIGTSDLTEATFEPGEPGYYGYETRTVWYSLTFSTNVAVRFNHSIVPPDPGNPPTLCDLRISRFMYVYREDGSGFGGLTLLASNPDTLQAHAGATYYIQGGDVQYWISGCPDTFGLNLSLVPPPPNDNFADAIAFGSVPFSNSQDMTGATVEQGEPMAYGSNFTKSIWYAFTPTASGTYGAYGDSNVNVYSGTSLENLTPVASAAWPGLYFHAAVGTTYYLQSYGGGISIDAVPPPNADFTFSPSDPSVYDNTTFSYFNNYYWDPTVTGYAWNFGDGTTATGDGVPHTFAHDGDYTVTITVSALGDRTNTASKTVHVQTHDVTILSLVAPDKGKVGKQGTITVAIGNTRYAQTVQVDLYKISPQGDVLVGTSIQTVGVMKLKKAINFTFNYVFTTDDLTVGTVPFKAIATIQGARDALLADNTATSAPTLVTN